MKDGNCTNHTSTQHTAGMHTHHTHTMGGGENGKQAETDLVGRDG